MRMISDALAHEWRDPTLPKPPIECGLPNTWHPRYTDETDDTPVEPMRSED